MHSEQITVEAQDYTAEAWHAAVLLDKPALFRISGFNPDIMKSALLNFTLADTHLYCTSGGGHGSHGVKMRNVFNCQNTKNLIRIEDGTYPEKIPPALLATNILQQACPPNCPLLKAWLQSQDIHRHTLQP